jgi:hypothetical protein
MIRVLAGRLAVLAACVCFAAPIASAGLVQWDINPAESNFRLTIPDQTVTLGTITATMRLRNQNNAAWTQNNAPVDGLLATDIGAGISSVEFLAGQSSLFGVNTGNYRPNPAVYNTAVTNTINTAGTFGDTSSAPGVYAARVNASVSILTLNTGYIMFDNVTYDLSSLVTAVTGTSFLSNAVNVGILDSRIGFDGINTGLAGQVIGDALGNTGPISAVNANGAAGSIVPLGGNNYRITVPINMPVFVSLSGVNLTATATGTLVGYAFIPEPATFALLGAGVAGIAIRARSRRRS